MTDESSKQNKNGTELPKANEPSENDPCIDFKTRNGGPRFWRSTQRHLCEKTGLSHRGLYIAMAVVIVLVILLIIVIALAASWPRNRHHLEYPVCSSPACLRAASQIQASLNGSCEPCADLWSWACGGWSKANPRPPSRSVWSRNRQLQVKEAALVRELATTLPHPVHYGTVEWNLKHLYEACTEVNNVDIEGARPLTKIIRNLGGWYILKNWNYADFDRNMILKRVHVEYGSAPFFKITVAPNPRVPGANSIVIAPSGLGLPDRSYYYVDQNDPIRLAYIQFVRDVVLQMGLVTQDADRFGTDMFFYEKRIAEITPPSAELLDPVVTYNPIKLSELAITAASLPLRDILTAMFPESNVTEETEVIVTSLDYLAKVSHLTSTTDNENLNGYVIWTLVRQYLPYISSNFTNSLSIFEGQLLGFQKPIQRWEKCAGVVQDFMGLATESMLEALYPITNTTKTTIEKMFFGIKSVAEKRLKKFQHYPQLYNHLTKKVSKLHIQVGLPMIPETVQYLKQYYRDFYVLKTDLFESYKNGIDFKRKLEERLVRKLPQFDRRLYYLTHNLKTVSYSPEFNTIVVPRAALSAFEEGYSDSIKFARLGVTIAEAVISSVLPYYSAWNGDYKLLSPYHLTVNESHAAIDSSKQCLKEFIGTHRLATVDVSDATILSTLKYLSAISVAYEALFNVLVGAPHVHQPSLEKFEDDALFFLTLAQEHCSVASEQRDLYDNIVNYQLSLKSLLKVSYWHLSTFSEAFDCINVQDQCTDIF